MGKKEPRFSQLCLAAVPLAKEISGNPRASGDRAIVHCLSGFQTNTARRIAKEWLEKRHPGCLVHECRVQSYLSIFSVNCTSSIFSVNCTSGDIGMQYVLFPDRYAKVVS